MDKSPDAFRTISEVADWLGTPTHVLRFWESRFTQVKPVKRAGGRRYYRPADMELLGGIKKLLHDDGMTIRGVQKLLREEGVKHVSAMSGPLDTNAETITAVPDDTRKTPDVPMDADVQPDVDNVVPISTSEPEKAAATPADEPAADTTDEPDAPDEPILEPDTGDAQAGDADLAEVETTDTVESLVEPETDDEPVPELLADEPELVEPDSAPEPVAPAPSPIVVDVADDPSDDLETPDIVHVASRLRSAGDALADQEKAAELKALYDRLTTLRSRMGGGAESN